MLWTRDMFIGLFLCAAAPYLAYKINKFLHDKSDPPWKKKE